MSKEVRFHVLGTKCASCEIVLERELGALPGVVRVDASHTSGEVTLVVEDGVTVTVVDLEKAVGSHGYRFSPGKKVVKPPFSWDKVLMAFIAVIAAYMVLSFTGLLTYSPEVDAGAGLSAVFVVGVVAAFSSCTAVIGGLVAAVAARQAKTHPGATFAGRMRPHIFFHMGRLIGFAGFGALIGLLGQALQFDALANGILVVVVALLMIAIGVELLGVLPNGIGIRPPKRLSHFVHDLGESNKPWGPAALGALTFFLPCGFTQSMQLLAMSTGSPAQAAAIMAVFALGTAPALLGIGAAAGAVRGPTLGRVTRVVGAFVVALGISQLGNGATLMGFNGFGSSGQEVSEAAVLDNGVQVVQMEVGSGWYSPDVLTVQEDVPVRWEIYGGNFLGCANTLVMPAFGVKTNIKTGYNEVNFTPTKAGEFRFSCSMGMVRGTMIVEPS